MGDLVSKFFVDPSLLPPGVGGFIQVSFLGLAYGYILGQASNLIASGSELLLLVPSLAGIVGPVVLPVLGAVPDGAIVLFSGLGPNAQEELAVGVGALAGSTIMLLTVPWFLSVVGGRVDIVDGEAQYRRPRGAAAGWKKLTPGNWSMTGAGVGGSSFVASNGLILIVTSAAYLIIQLPAFYANFKAFGSKETARLESNFAGGGILVCLTAFIWYLGHQWRQAGAGKDKTVDWKVVQVRIKAIKEMNLSLRAVLTELRSLQEVRSIVKNLTSNYASVAPSDTTITNPNGPAILEAGGADDHGAPVSADPTTTSTTTSALQSSSMALVDASVVNPMDSGAEGMKFGDQPLLGVQIPDRVRNQLLDVLKPFFEEHDYDRNGKLDKAEVKHLFHSLNEFPTPDQLERIFSSFDVDQSSTLELSEFTEVMVNYLIHPSSGLETKGREASLTRSEHSVEEEEEIPEDLAHLPYKEQQTWIKRRSCVMMLLGTCLVLLFSDPMVSVFSDLGQRSGVPAFYVSFILAPLASNLSELIASFNYSLKKTKRSIEISFSSLLGAGCMNNTFCLGVFLAIVYFRGLVWQYSAETIAIIAVELFMAIVAQFKVIDLRTSLFVLTLFPLSLFLVAGLNSAGMQ